MGRISPVPMPCIARPTSATANGGSSALNCADEEGTQREHGELSRREPLHEQARKRQNHTDHKHIAHHKPLRDGYVDAKSKGQLRQGDIKCSLAVHTGEVAAEKPYEREVGRIQRIKKRSQHARCDYLYTSYQRLTAPFDSLKLSTNRKRFVSGD